MKLFKSHYSYPRKFPSKESADPLALKYKYVPYMRPSDLTWFVQNFLNFHICYQTTLLNQLHCIGGRRNEKEEGGGSDTKKISYQNMQLYVYYNAKRDNEISSWSFTTRVLQSFNIYWAMVESELKEFEWYCYIRER